MYTPGILHTDSKFLKMEHIDHQKAITLMKSIRQLQDGPVKRDPEAEWKEFLVFA